MSFSQKVPFSTNIWCCLNFLDYGLTNKVIIWTLNIFHCFFLHQHLQPRFRLIGIKKLLNYRDTRVMEFSWFLMFPVFLTQVCIWQMLMWLSMWKAKSLYHLGTFLLTWFFLPLQKFRTIKKQSQKIIPMSKQIHTYYIFQGILKIFSNIYALLFIFNKH